MTADEVRRILGVEQMTQHQLYSNRHNAFINTNKHKQAHLAGYFTAEELRAIAYWLDNREEFGNGDSTDLVDAPVIHASDCDLDEDCSCGPTTYHVFTDSGRGPNDSG